MTDQASKKDILDRIRKAVIAFNDQDCPVLCRTALDMGWSANDIVIRGMAAGMEHAGELFERHEYFVPELLLCSDAFYAGLEVLRPHLKTGDAERRSTMLIGVIEGDIHDIGKNLVKLMFEADGWSVHDLGCDVKLDRFVEEQQRTGASMVAVSALMTTSMAAMPGLIKMLKTQDPEVKVLVGGAPLNQGLADRYGADGYARDGRSAVAVARAIMKNTGIENPTMADTLS
jgi:methanogenic corrinoid protein MtbC1